mmetsp:Transcript_2235/g.3037  ORF Transcript_2235/g.3037 Transcript_2235/m.3037 type:complete len:165 (+) Transcript_2235:170-664(+)
MEDALDVSFFKHFDFDVNVLSFPSPTNEPKLLKIESLLIHLSNMIGKNICQYMTPFPTNTSASDSGMICCSIAQSDENSPLILLATPPTKIIEQKWISAFIPLPPWGGELSATKLVSVNGSYPSIPKNIAKREASLKRQRDGKGKFKRCVTKWVPATDFYEEST